MASAETETDEAMVIGLSLLIREGIGADF